MPRTARLVLPEVSLHVVHRGHDRADCFIDETDYVSYLVALGTYAARFRCAIHAYCLMTNHVHLLVTPHDSTGCALLMKHLAQRHSKRINAKLDRTGALWEGRYYSGLVATDEYAVACYRYVELNPVRAAMVAHPSQYRWSSYKANVLTDPHSFVTGHPSFLALGTHDHARTAAYKALCNDPLKQEIIDEIRRATYGGHRMGGPRKRRGRPKRSAENGDCHQLEMVTVTL
ncbi:MAG TPA: transposase [Burkholderiales bacterium]|nr:transposase [Burkholderiales bacterium]